MLNFELYNPNESGILGKATEKLEHLTKGAKILLAYGGGSII
jgi:alcohol dehydrogenase YqhD (iron-dependent ADH family)